jgi:hypothetical protein
MIGAAQLHVDIFEEVEEDTSATIQALGVVLLVAIATGIANLGNGDPVAFVLGIVISIAGWALWAWVTYFVGTRILGTESTHADWGQMARALAFAQAPGVLKVLGVIPYLGPVLLFLIFVWQLAAMVVAIRQALDYTSTWRAVGVAAIGFIPYIVGIALLTALL